jgi:hypothetical protein
MDASFWIKLGLSFLIGGAWVAMATFLAGRFGSRVGGLVGGFPSTIVVILLFVGLTQDVGSAARSTTVIPVAMGCNGLFVVVFLLLSRRGLAWGLVAALAAWFLLAGSLVVLGLRSLSASLAGWLLLSVFCWVVLRRRVACEPVDVPAPRAAHLVLRACASGSVIAGAVLAAKLAGPLLGGVLAVFPAIFLSTLVITYRAGGQGFAWAVGRSLLLSGLLNVPVYALAVRWLYPWCGIAKGTLLALVVSLLTAYLSYRLARFEKA